MAEHDEQDERHRGAAMTDAVSDDEMAQAMHRYGGSFVRTLAALLHCADDDNRARILATWPEYCAEYRDMVRLQRARL